MEEKKKKAYRVGVTVMILLAVLTIGEYFIGSIAIGWWAPLIVIAMIKAFFVIRDYMHISRLFNSEDEVQV
ncbi:cytochrome C oxidase subunit IV family protein [Chloroflexota bacterium]